MRSDSKTRIPPLAGLCTHEEAAEPGLPLDESVRRLLRFHWVERRLKQILVSRIPSTPEWEAKGGFSLHQWLDAEHAQALGDRIREMRSPPPRTDRPPAPELEAFLDEVAAAVDTVELVVGVYRVARSALVAAYRDYLDAANPISDHPTRRVLRFALTEEEEAVTWGEGALAALTAEADAESRADAWEGHLRAYLDAAGGIAGPAPAERREVPRARGPSAPEPDLRPRRDARFDGLYAFDFPPHAIYQRLHLPADERNLALACKRLLEMDVPEMMASFLTERPEKPWDFHREYGRHLWDEARHSMMGEVLLERLGVDWTEIPLNVGFSLRLNLHAEPFERQLVLWAIEQGLMRGDTGKRYEHRTAEAAGDALSAHFQDFDWADEVLHAQIGRRWITEEGWGLQEAKERGREIYERTWRDLERYPEREPLRTGWWGRLVRQALGRETETRPEDLRVDPGVLSE